MNLLHLARRFAGALRPGPPSAEDEAWAAEVLAPEELLLFRRLPNHDRRHAVHVARRTDEALGAASESRWVVTAMLHDVGKHDADLSVPGRVIATVALAGGAGPRRVERWANQGGVRRRFALYARHGEIGAEQIRRAGGRDEAAVWSEAHHHPEMWSALSIPPEVVQVLDAADQT
jgi:hypothetical protein